MWIPNEYIEQVEDLVTIDYLDHARCALWNEHRRPGEMRLFTGWCWTAKTGNEHQQGLKTYSACVRDAYYSFVLRTNSPRIRRLQAVRKVA
jgi:hypothetical protein